MSPPYCDRIALAAWAAVLVASFRLVWPLKYGARLSSTAFKKSTRRLLAGQRIDSLADGLSGILKRKVLDKTGLLGEFDVDLKWTPDNNNPVNPQEAAPPTDGPSIFTAIEEQLGLKLESGKAPIDVLVIDHIDHVSDN